MRAPDFWFQRPGVFSLISTLLLPFSWLWAIETRRRLRSGNVTRLNIPVICIGNLTIGGTGKTPTATAIVERLRARGLDAHIISRGYGGQLPGPVRVDPLRHGAEEVGDEPLLLSAFAPVWIARDRSEAGKAAQSAGADVLVMDDGFQNPGLHKDLSVVVVDAVTGFGNNRVIPSGPLREPVADGLKRTDIILLIGDDDYRARFARSRNTPAQIPQVHGHLKPLATGMDWEGLRTVAFAGIGRPAKFFESLEREGADIVARHGFSDHEPYEMRALTRLATEARSLNAQLVTTEKDAVRLPASFRSDVLVFPVRLDVVDWAPFDNALSGLGL